MKATTLERPLHWGFHGPISTYQINGPLPEAAANRDHRYPEHRIGYAFDDLYGFHEWKCVCGLHIMERLYSVGMPMIDAHLHVARSTATVGTFTTDI